MTGLRLVEQLLEAGHKVRAIVRSPHKFQAEILNHPNLIIIEAAILDLSDEELTRQVKNCDAIVSCLGHVVSFHGMFGHPRKLCTDATRRLCQAIENNNTARPTKFILMSTVGVKNPDYQEKRTRSDRILLTLLRYLLPPHRDNETAAEHLYKYIAKNNGHIEWCAVRPDSLINAQTSPYKVIKSPQTTILSGHPTTRANVAHFIKALIENEDLWNKWKFEMPVIFNRLLSPIN